ncbi:YtxH-like protein [Melghirimyces profundicolus]|uniref:YtxH-like protein n=1 Tax=Melghirimyces profundicolus TaxID=1242148 RepID=A0A2T6BGL1_9BACL|nr:YtxH domain-containing protein [Melghirimyces profundicolus]PTX55190.1 YtxH-like protein [Melghirimyces profundicolus]
MGQGKAFFGAVIGGMIGAAAALLLAPKTGRETREELLKSLDEAKETFRYRSGDLARMAGEMKETASEKWIELRGFPNSQSQGEKEPEESKLVEIGGRKTD